MTLTDTKILLTEHGISFEQIEYESEKDFWVQYNQFAPTKNNKLYPFIILLIRSNNGKKHLVLLFKCNKTDFVFDDLLFGDFNFGMSNFNINITPEDLIDNIKTTMSSKIHIINTTDLRSHRWCSHARYDESEDEAEDDTQEYLRAIERIKRPRSWLGKLFKITKRQYEIYDWNNYYTIIK